MTRPPPLLGRLTPPQWLTVTAVLLAPALRLAAGARAVDDAYITFRYAVNFLAGQGLVYNAGDAVLGTSAPLYALLLAGLARLGAIQAVPEIALWVNALADATSVGLVFLVSRRIGLREWVAGLASVMVGLSPLVVRYSIGGMETSLLSAVCLLSVYMFLGDRRIAPFVLAGLAVWIRPDAIAFGAALLIAAAWSERRFPWRSVAALAILPILEVILLVAYYGDPLPQSVLAKAHHVYRTDAATNFLQHVYLFSGLSLAGSGGFGARGLVVPSAPALDRVALVSFVLQATIWGAGAIRAVRNEARSLALALYPLIFTAAYSFLGLRGGLMAEWYLVPLVPFWLILLLSGLESISESLRRPRARAVVWSMAIALLITEIAGYNLGKDPSLPPSLPQAVWTEREDLYLRAAGFLRDRAPVGSVVAASEIGALGYACNCLILDTVGLVSQSVSAYYPLPDEVLVVNYAVPDELVAELRPDYVVSLEVFLRRTLLRDAAFRADYREIWRADTNAFGSQGLLIFERVTSPQDG